MDRSLGEELPCGLPVEGVEGPPPAPLLAHKPGVLELLYVVEDLRLWPIEKASSNSQTQMPSSPSSAGAPEPEKSHQPLPSAIMESILTRMGSERARPSATSHSAPSSTSPFSATLRRRPFSSTTPSFSALTMPPARTVCGP
jgi:hypothetical protein